MPVYGGFDPGTWQAWSLNLLSQVFVKPGIARGFQVTQISTPAMEVKATLDSTWSDGVLYLTNGAFMRIDVEQGFTISNNTSGTTRTDALIAVVDPANAGNTGLSIQANWSTGFTAPNNNTFVIALISVPNNATQILNANITMNSAVATITGTNISGNNSIIAADGDGLALQDNSASSTMTLVMTGLTTGVGRSLILQTTDISAIGHSFTFGTDDSLASALGTFIAAISASSSNGAAGNQIWFGTTDPGSKASEGDIWIGA